MALYRQRRAGLQVNSSWTRVTDFVCRVSPEVSRNRKRYYVALPRTTWRSLSKTFPFARGVQGVSSGPRSSGLNSFPISSTNFANTFALVVEDEFLVQCTLAPDTRRGMDKLNTESLCQGF